MCELSGEQANNKKLRKLISALATAFRLHTCSSLLSTTHKLAHVFVIHIPYVSVRCLWRVHMSIEASEFRMPSIEFHSSHILWIFKWMNEDCGNWFNRQSANLIGTSEYLPSTIIVIKAAYFIQMHVFPIVYMNVDGRNPPKTHQIKD